jgi:hypothetical protein
MFLMTVNVSIFFFWALTPCGLVDRYQYTFSIFKAEDVAVYFHEMLLSAFNSTQRYRAENISKYFGV